MQFMDFFQTWYGFLITAATAIGVLYGGAKAVGALRKWCAAKYEERQQRLKAPEMTLELVQTLRKEMEAANAAQNEKIHQIETTLSRVEKALEDNTEQVGTLQCKELNWAYIYYGIKHKPLPLQSKNSLQQMYEQYTRSGKRNHVPSDWQEKINSCPIEGE